MYNQCSSPPYFDFIVFVLDFRTGTHLHLHMSDFMCTIQLKEVFIHYLISPSLQICQSERKYAIPDNTFDTVHL